MSDPTLTDFEKGPWSYDLYAGGLEPVGLLNDHTDEAQGEWVSIEDYRKLESELNDLRAKYAMHHAEAERLTRIELAAGALIKAKGQYARRLASECLEAALFPANA